MTRAIQRVFWWPKLRSTVQDFIGQCYLCQTNKFTNQKSAGLLTSLPIPTGNWTDISTDLIVALSHTTTGYDAILVWVCNNNNNKRPLTPKSMPPAGDEHAKLKT